MRPNEKMVLVLMLLLSFGVGEAARFTRKLVSVGGTALLTCDWSMFAISPDSIKKMKLGYVCHECSSLQVLVHGVKTDKGFRFNIQNVGPKFEDLSKKSQGIRVVFLDMQQEDSGLFQCVLTLNDVNQDGTQTLEYSTYVKVQDPAVAPIENTFGYEAPLTAVIGILSILVTLLISYGIAKFVQALIIRMNSEEAQLINHLVRTRYFRW